MSNTDKIRQKVLVGDADAAIDFDDLRKLLHAFGFSERIKGSHHIFTRIGVREIINIQPKNNKGKAYQL